MGQHEIIGRIKEGDRAAFDALCRERYASLISYARLFLRRDCAEDIVQDVLFSVWLRRSFLDEEQNLQSYLIRSVYNRCMNCLAEEKRSRQYASYYQQKVSSLMSAYYSPDNNPTVMGIYNADLRQNLEKAIDNLSPRCREVFTLSYIEHLSGKQISERLGLSLSTVENHIYSALKQLRLSLTNL